MHTTTRRVLDQIVAAVKAMPVPRESVRFSRREVRGWTGASDTQARAHLERLVNLEYLLTHRGQRGQSFEYELMYDGDGGDSTHLAGLLDVTTIQSSRGQTGEFAGSSRPQSGANAVGSRGEINRGEADDIRLSADRSTSDVKTHCSGKRELNVVDKSLYTQ